MIMALYFKQDLDYIPSNYFTVVILFFDNLIKTKLVSSTLRTVVV